MSDYKYGRTPFESTTFTPTRTITVNVNGQECHFEAGKEITVLGMFRDAYQLAPVTEEKRVYPDATWMR